MPSVVGPEPVPVRGQTATLVRLIGNAEKPQRSGEEERNFRIGIAGIEEGQIGRGTFARPADK